MAKKEVSDDFASFRLDTYLAAVTGLARKIISDASACGLIYVNGKARKSSYKLKCGECVEYDDNAIVPQTAEIEPENIPLDIKYEDDFLLVINKPKGMLTHPSAYQKEHTLVNALLNHCGKNLSNSDEPMRRGIVHRLDKNTAGLMLASKTDSVQKKLQEQIKNKTAIRKYLAVALGEFSEDSGIIDKPLVHYMTDTVKMQVSNDGVGKPAITHYKLLERYKGAALLELELKTGRTHQIRAHLSSIGHPVFGDTLYGAKGCTPQRYRGIKTNEQVLQSYYLGFTHPDKNEIMTFELTPDEWDNDLVKVLKVMRENK